MRNFVIFISVYYSHAGYKSILFYQRKSLKHNSILLCFCCRIKLYSAFNFQDSIAVNSILNFPLDDSPYIRLFIVETYNLFGSKYQFSNSVCFSLKVCNSIKCAATRGKLIRGKFSKNKHLHKNKYNSILLLIICE